MKTFRCLPRCRASVMAVNAALAVLGAVNAQAQGGASPASVPAGDPGWADFVVPKSTAELGTGVASRYAAKAFEYSGWADKGPHVFGNIDLRGGGAYDSGDASRWRITGSQLGSKAPSLGVEFGVQGHFRLRLEAGQLLRHQSDSYQTPYLGAGAHAFTLPPGWVVPVVPRVGAAAPNARGLAPAVTGSNAIVGGISTPPTAAQAAAASALQGADLSAFQPVDLFTKRSRYGLNWEQSLSSRWTLTTGVSREHKTGLKPLGAQSRATGADTSSILPVPVDQHDTQFNVGLAYTGERLQLQAGYESSVFVNEVPSVTWNLWAAPGISATAATAPSNQFRKLLFSGQYRAAEATTLVAHASYSRATQDAPLRVDATALLVPTATANALVVNESAGLKLLHKASRALTLSAAYKVELRDNRTPVNLFGFYDNNNAPSATPSPFAYLYPGLKGLGDNFNLNANTPYSRRENQVDLEGDYHLGGSHHLKLGLASSRTARYCRGSWINCADATRASEHTLKLDWRGNVSDNLSARVAVLTARRRVDYDESAFLARVPMAGQSPASAQGTLAGSSAYGALAALGLTGYGPVSGLAPAAAAGSAQAFYFPNNNALNNLLYGNENRISELPGMRRFDQADRSRGRLRSSVAWQATEQFALQGGFDASADRHTRSIYGLQRVANWAVNLDATYTPNDRYSASLFGTVEQQRSRSAGNSYTANSAATAVNGASVVEGGCFPTLALRNASNKVDPCLDWTASTRDRTLTIGGTASALRLLGGRLDLTGSAVYSQGRTAIDVSGGSYVNNPFAGAAGAATRAVAAFYVPASALPLVRVNSLEVAVVGTGHIGDRQAIRLGYGYQRLSSSDWADEGLQDGGLTQVLPSRESSPRHRIHRIGVTYVIDF